MEKVKVLLIAYYWPPSGGGGVFRWLKMSKYIHNYNIDLTIYTPLNPEHPVLDNSLLDDISPNIKIIRNKIIEPYTIYKILTGKKISEKIYSGFITNKASFFEKLSIWIRGNFFIPDARVFWVKPSVKFLNSFLQENPQDVIITTGPPHSLHLIGRSLKRNNKDIIWISDFRDPWTNIDFYKTLNLSWWADKIHKDLERSILNEANCVVTVTKQWAEDFSKLTKNKNIMVISNGYDHEDFEGINPSIHEISLVHLGSINKDRNPSVLWQALKEIKKNDFDFYEKIKIQLIGPIDQLVLNQVQEYDIGSSVLINKFVDHKEAIKIMASSHALLLLINNTNNSDGLLTGKVYEYIGSGRPIFCIGPEEGEIKELISTNKNSFYCGFTDTEKCKKYVYEIFSNQYSTIEKTNSEYSRQSLSKKYSNLIHELVDKRLQRKS